MSWSVGRNRHSLLGCAARTRCRAGPPDGPEPIPRTAGAGLNPDYDAIQFQPLDALSADARQRVVFKLLDQALAADLGFQNHAGVASSLHYLANLYRDQVRFDEAEALYKRCLLIRKNVLGSEDKLVAATLGDLADLYRSQGRQQQAA